MIGVTGPPRQATGTANLRGRFSHAGTLQVLLARQSSRPGVVENRQPPVEEAAKVAEAAGSEQEMMGGYGPMMGWTWLFWLLVVIVLVILGVIAARGFSRGDAGAKGARRILDERYARGELSTAEYHERLKNLGNGT